MRVIAVIPAFNECAAISEVVRDVTRHVDEVIVVDDGSSDATAARVHEAGALVFEHVINRGQGAALQTGVHIALDQGADIIIHFDADGQMDAHDIPRLVHVLLEGGYDAVLGSRFLSQTTDMPVLRKFSKRIVLLFHWLLTGVRLTDVHCGFRVFTADAARRINLSHDRMAHATEIEAEIGRLNLRYREYPVNVRYTAYARAKSMPWFTHVWQVVRDLIVGNVLKRRI